MRTITHVAASTVLSAGTYAVFGTGAAAGVFIGGGLLDVDHLGLYLDIGLPLRIKPLLSCLVRSEGELEKAYSISRGVPEKWYFPGLHSIELIGLTAAAGLLLSCRFLVGMAAGMTLHVSMDLGNYPCSPRIWSMIWRYRNREKLLRAWGTYEVKTRF